MLFFDTYFDFFPSLFVFDIGGTEHVLQGDLRDVVLLVVDLAQAQCVLQPFLQTAFTCQEVIEIKTCTNVLEIGYLLQMPI
jgi:hypothetical protein